MCWTGRPGRRPPWSGTWASAGRPKPGVAHHNIHFADAWSESFDQLIKRRELMTDPSRLVTIPSLDAPGMAPAGHSVLFVLEPVPHLGAGIDWTAERGPARERLHRFLAANGYPDDIVTEQLVTPADWAAQGMAMGTPFSLAHTFGQTGPFRPSNVEPRVPGVFFAGSGTTPGVGVPMVLISGELAADRVRDYLGGAAMTIVGTPTDLAAGYAECARLTREYGTTYFWGAVLLPRPQRRHVHAVYALCRLADDIVDAEGATRFAPAATRQALADFRAGFDRALAGDPPDATMAAIAHTVAECGIETECFDRFFDAMAMDLDIAGYDTWDDLCGYMEGSAAVIGEMMLPVLQPLTPAAKEPARALGLAFQLTNFLRDVGEDLGRGRVYLPQEDLDRFGASPVARQGRRRVARADGLRDRAEPRAVRAGAGRGRHAAAALGPVRGDRAHPVLADPRPHRGARLRRVLRPRPGAHLAQGRHRCLDPGRRSARGWRDAGRVPAADGGVRC